MSSAPTHIAIIMDGNGRWARQRNLPRNAGHKQGAEALRSTIKACLDLGVRYLTVYSFSTENWARPSAEVSFLMGFFSKLLAQETPKLHKQNVQVRCLGHTDAFSTMLQKQIAQTHETTQHNDRMQLNLMLNYGGRLELVHATQRIASAVQSGDLTPEAIDETTLNDALYTAPTPDPDMLIRTGGNNIRLSNFLLWQCAYTEMFFLPTLWPDFNADVLTEAIANFNQRDRKFGGLND